jgi:hypothetical protein
VQNAGKIISLKTCVKNTVLLNAPEGHEKKKERSRNLRRRQIFGVCGAAHFLKVPTVNEDIVQINAAGNLTVAQ